MRHSSEKFFPRTVLRPILVVAFWDSTVGKKIVMAVTGAIGVGYLIGHVAGNLLIYQGPARIDAYAAFLKSNPGLLWATRAILLLAVSLHIIAAFQLARISQKSRPVAYKRWRAVGSDFASRTMRWTGPIVGIFIVYHLLHFTTGTIHPDFREGQVYHNVTTGFRVWYTSAFYIVAMLALLAHLYHGAWSMFQSLGLNHPKYNRLVRALATIVTVVVVIGFTSIPVAVLLGLIA
ncbi:MAG TPA: succinate dehydrogenase cytochrome b subunit [Pyrinomonadaceae bacterium]|nr:succinate dehydrogenase cytochrome b subunit [Pyrinomonadaceae bacterium]